MIPPPVTETKKLDLPSCMRCGRQLKHGELVCEVRKGILTTCPMHGFDFFGQEYDGWMFISLVTSLSSAITVPPLDRIPLAAPIRSVYGLPPPPLS